MECQPASPFRNPEKTPGEQKYAFVNAGFVLINYCDKKKRLILEFKKKTEPLTFIPYFQKLPWQFSFVKNFSELSKNLLVNDI